MTDRQINTLVNSILDDGPLEVEIREPNMLHGHYQLFVRKDGMLVGFFIYRIGSEFYFEKDFIESNGVVKMLEWDDMYKVVKGVFKKMVSMLGTRIPKKVYPQDLTFQGKVGNGEYWFT
jgi:hypothetical protein